MLRTAAVIAVACVSLSSCTKRSFEDAMGDLTLEDETMSKHLRFQEEIDVEPQEQKRMPPVSEAHAAFDHTTFARWLPIDVLAMIDDHMGDFYPEIETIETTASYFPKLTSTLGNNNRGPVFIFKGKTNHEVFPPMNKEGDTSRRRMMSLFIVDPQQSAFTIPAATQLRLKTNGEACADLAFFSLSPDLKSKTKLKDRDELNIMHQKQLKIVNLAFDFNRVSKEMVQGTTIALYNPPQCQLTVKYAYQRLPPFNNRVDAIIAEARRNNRQVQLELFTNKLEYQ